MVGVNAHKERLVKWDDYVLEAQKTIVFDSTEKLIFCTTTGLMGEFTEFVVHTMYSTNKDLIKKELGDVLWYLAVLTNHFKIGVEKYKPIGKFSHVPVKDPLQGFILIGSIQEILKKVVRDNHWELPSGETANKLEESFSLLFLLIQKICIKNGFGFEEILDLNIKKLADRKARGVLQGSGDER